MKTIRILLSVIVLVSATVACGIGPITSNVKLIEPSNNVVTEERPVSGFSGVDMGTFGEVIISQGDTESLTVKGSDNIVPLIRTSVRNGVLVISMEEDVNITGMNSENILTFTISVKDLTDLTVSGAGNVSMDSLATQDFEVVMSGAGQVQVDSLTAESLNVNINGVGNVETAGQATSLILDISGAGNLNAPDLKVQSADVTISGIGGAELWVTDELTGTISGGGNVKYYGSPTVNTNTTGIGTFQPMGNK